MTTLVRKEIAIVIDTGWGLTEEGKRLYEPTVAIVAKKPTEMSIAQLHISLQNRLFHHIKKKQIAGFGGTYFIPTQRDLEDFLNRFRRKYADLWDLAKIEKALIHHIDKCCKEKKYAPAIKYYIIKEGTGSQLAAALENMEDTVEVEEQQYDIVNTKDLFS
jgi:hypothetical protein